MLSVETIREQLKTSLSDRRYRHSLGVAAEAEKLAQRYGADAEKAYLAGLVHDCAKEIPPNETVRRLREQYGEEPDAIAIQMPWLLHGALGARMAQSEFGICDAEILDAIRYHTTGKAGMSLLTKIIYIADMIEPGRDYPDVERLRKLTYADLSRGVLFGAEYTIGKQLAQKQAIHPETVHCYNDLLLYAGG